LKRNEIRLFGIDKVDTLSRMDNVVTPRLSFKGLKKAFDATVALDDVSFDVAPGEVHALLGANGAGKSTLIKILAGVYTPDSGVVLIDGKAPQNEVSFIHQELGLVDTQTVAEAVAMSQGFARRLGLINWSQVRKNAEAALAVIGAKLPLDSLVSELSRADRSIIAIARAINDECKVLVLDEPTASLPDRDVDILFEIIAKLKSRGVSILYVTHRLDEVDRIADVVTVLRDGKLIKTANLKDINRNQLVHMIVGSNLPERLQLESVSSTTEAAVLKNIALAADRAAIPEVRIRKGEILGFAGLRGSGQELLGRGLAGVTPISFSELVTSSSASLGAKQAIKWLRANVGFGSSRREIEGLAMTLTVRENLYINPGAFGRKPFAWNGLGKEMRTAQAIANALRIRPRSAEVAGGTLSGGNQQKVILGRLLATDAEILVLEEPTMGIDVGARAEIYRIIADAAKDGRTFVIVSSDFEELSLICHRVLVFDKGVIVKSLSGKEITTDEIIHYSSGALADKKVAIK
jgi:ribose transport system ATP-binding protein